MSQVTISPEDQARARAREYFAANGTQASAAQVHERVAAAFSALDAALAGVTAVQASRRPIAGEWSAQEIVDHLLETHRPGVDELRCLLAGQRPPGEPIPAALQSKAPRLRPWSWLLDELRRVHREILDLLAAVPPDAPDRGARSHRDGRQRSGAGRCGWCRCTGSRTSTGRPTRSSGACTPSIT